MSKWGIEDSSDLKVLEEGCSNYLANKLSTKVVDITKKFPLLRD